MDTEKRSEKRFGSSLSPSLNRRLDALMELLASLYSAPASRRSLIGFVVAICGVFWRYAATDVLGERVLYATFYPVVTIAALFGGLVSGSSAALAAALMAHLWFGPLSAPGDWLGLGIFLTSCVMISCAAEMLHRTWKRMSEAELRQSQAERLYLMRQERLTAMGGMAAALAHELNQPLAATAIYLKAAKRLAILPENRRSASVADTLDLATEQIMRAGQIISHMRQFADFGESDKTICSLNRLVDEALDLSSEALKEANVAVTLELGAEKDTVLADSVQIKQVLINLIRNSRDAMNDSARRQLTISTSNEKQNSIRVDIADTGPGLSKTMQGKLFEPFATTKASGMGIGLSVSRSIIEAHYGRIWAAEKSDCGAVFSFELPLVEPNGRCHVNSKRAD
ncbi:hypothetical protein IY145_02060 [Methylosinus sp. H3A]|uniref:sensor histidine kinase n=1 Tax=Methylosinus sp. H3A TaxID=2785786 RepID=UPI0018C287A4|nr:ATP-binding protein [Methylosinus sp. H3A]MBG0808192.1 hypothetical protein [Methylosinus sp. H3A]